MAESGGAVAAPSAALLERLRNREEELKRRDKELRLRDSQLKDRAQELDLARRSVDSLMAELEQREAAIAETEARLGSVKQREEEAHSRDMALSEREAMAQDKLATALRREKELAAQQRQAQREAEERASLLSQREGELMKKVAEIQASEDEVAAKAEALTKRAQELEDASRAREKLHRDAEAKVAEGVRKNAQREQDLEFQAAELAERGKVLRADALELETRERDCKWQEEELRAGLSHCTTRKHELQRWAAALAKQAEDLEQRLAAIAHREAVIDSLHEEAKMKLVVFTQTEAHHRDREVRIEKRESEVQAAEAALKHREVAVAARESSVSSVAAEAAALIDANRRKQEELRVRAEVLDKQQHVMREKERALRDWLVELEFREAAIERREAKPRGYLSDAKTRGAGPQHVGAAGNTQASPSHSDGGAGETVGAFNSAVLRMQLSQLQGAYLGATLKARFRRTAEQDAQRTQTPLSRNAAPDATSSSIEEHRHNQGVVAAVRELEKEFRNLVAAYVIMSKDERAGLFTPTEETTVIEAIEFENDIFDEQTFLAELTSSPLPAVDLVCSPQDAKLYSVVNRWLADRSRLIEERQRRVQTRRLHSLNSAVAVLRGRVPRKEERHQIFEQAFSDGSPGKLDAGFKARARSRLPAIMHQSSPMSLERDPRIDSPGGGQDCSSDAATPQQRERSHAPSPAVATPQPVGASRSSSFRALPEVHSRAATPGPTAGRAPSRSKKRAVVHPADLPARDRLIDALPSSLRHHYTSSGGKM